MSKIILKTKTTEVELTNCFIIELQPVFMAHQKKTQYQVHITNMGKSDADFNAVGVMNKLIEKTVHMIDDNAPDDKGFIYSDDNGDKIPLISVGIVYDREKDDVYTVGLKGVPFFTGSILSVLFQLMDMQPSKDIEKLLSIAPPPTGYQKLYNTLAQCHDGVGDIYIESPEEFKKFVDELDIITTINPMIVYKNHYFSFYHGSVFKVDEHPCWDRLFKAKDILEQLDECYNDHVMGMEYVCKS